MAITQTYSNNFMTAILDGTHDFSTGGDSFKMALYDVTAELNQNDQTYTATGEVVGTGYTATGKALTGQSVTRTASTGWVDFADPVWTSSTIDAGGAMIYNDTDSGDASVLIIDFGAEYSSTAGDFTVVFPAADSTNAIIRLTRT